jgi:hypothetical protein
MATSAPDELFMVKNNYFLGSFQVRAILQTHVAAPIWCFCALIGNVAPHRTIRSPQRCFVDAIDWFPCQGVFIVPLALSRMAAWQ